MGRPLSDGHLLLSQLPPGDYYAVPLEINEQGFDRSPDTLEKLSRGAERFTLFENEKKQLALRFVP